MNTTSLSLDASAHEVLTLVHCALIDQTITPSTQALCAVADDNQLLVALQSAALLDVLWDGMLVQNSDLSTVFWAQVSARLDEQGRLDTLLPYIDTHGTLFGISVQPQCAPVLESAFVHLAAWSAQTLEVDGAQALQDDWAQLDGNVMRLRALLEEQFEPMMASAHQALEALAQGSAQDPEQSALALCADVLAHMLVAALNEPQAS